MRFHLAVSALSGLAVGLIPVVAQSRTSSSGLSRRMFSDTCALLDGPLVIPISGLGADVSVADLHMCACVADIPNLEDTNPFLVRAVALVGSDAVAAALAIMIMMDGSAQTCNYPDNAISACEIENPCAYTCGNGFTYSPDTGDCVCESPNTVCGGQCRPSCPSAIAVERRTASPYERVANRRRMCPRGYTACGIFEQRGRATEPWECVDARHDLESCGGCMTPFDDLSPRGVDCTAIPGVADVSCMQGSCFVRRCMSGYAVTSDRSRCISTR